MPAVLTIVVVIGLLIIIREHDKKTIAAQPDARQVEDSFIQIEDDAERIECPSWVVLDVETTGLDPKTDRVIEFAARRYIDGLPGAEYQTLINPCCYIPPKVTELTGIRAEDLQKQKTFRQVSDAIVATIGDLPVVAHNAKFDAEFLVRECARCGIKLNLRYIDTVRMARWAYPGMENYKLKTLIRALDLLDHDQSHRAMDDVNATANLYLRCRARLAHAPRRTVGPEPIPDPQPEPAPASTAPDENLARCPYCGSTSITAAKRGYRLGIGLLFGLLLGGCLFWLGGIIGGLIGFCIGLAIGAAGSRTVTVTCLKCGRKSYPGQRSRP